MNQIEIKGNKFKVRDHVYFMTVEEKTNEIVFWEGEITGISIYITTDEWTKENKTGISYTVLSRSLDGIGQRLKMREEVLFKSKEEMKEWIIKKIDSPYWKRK